MSHHPHHRIARHRRQDGVTLVEVLIAIGVVALIVPVIASAVSTSAKTTSQSGDRIAKTDDSERIATYWTRDVQSADLGAAGVAFVVNGSTCGTIAAGQTLLVSFTWGTGAGLGPVKTATWLTTGTGKRTKIIRRSCSGGTVVGTTLIASSFMDNRTTPIQAVHGAGTPTTNFCTATDCTIVIDGNYKYQLKVQRRAGTVGTGTPTVTGTVPDLFAVSEFSGTNVIASGANCGLYIYDGSVSTTTIRKVTNVPAGCTSPLYGVVAINATAAYAVGANGTILRCSASCNTIAGTWTVVPRPSGVSATATLYSVNAAERSSQGRQANSITAVGDNGTAVVCIATCATADSGWVKVTSASLNGLTLTSVSVSQGDGGSNFPSGYGGVAYMTARGLADSANNKGRLLRCTSACLTAGGTWSLATGNLPNGTGELTAVAAHPNGNGGRTWVAADGGRLMTCVNCASSPAFGGVATTGQTSDIVGIAIPFGDSGRNPTGVTFNGSVIGCTGTYDACTGNWALRRNVGVRLTAVTRTTSGTLGFIVGTKLFMRIDPTSTNAATYVSLSLAP